MPSKSQETPHASHQPSAQPRFDIRCRTVLPLAPLLFLLLPLLLARTLSAQTTGTPAPSTSAPGSSSPTGITPFGAGSGGPAILSNPLAQPTLSSGALFLIELEARFAKAVAEGGGKAFATWFADDAVTLNNGRPAVLGRANIARDAQWDPKTYQLTWIPSGAQMGPSNDMGFTWGRYEGHSVDKNGGPVVTSGRYMTVWKKEGDGTWKVIMDASANDSPESGECCTLPKP